MNYIYEYARDGITPEQADLMGDKAEYRIIGFDWVCCHKRLDIFNNLWFPRTEYRAKRITQEEALAAYSANRLSVQELYLSASTGRLEWIPSFPTDEDAIYRYTPPTISDTKTKETNMNQLTPHRVMLLSQEGRDLHEQAISMRDRYKGRLFLMHQLHRGNK